MSLLAFQIELARRVGTDTRVRSTDLPSEHRLQGIEVACLARVSEGRGLAFTRAVRRSWCLMRTARAARLTLSILALDARKAVLEAWVDAGGGTSSFFANDAESFLEFLAQRLPEPSHELSLCRLEQGIHRAMNAVSLCHPPSREVNPGCRLRVGAGATLVSLFADPKQILRAAHAGRPLPTVFARPVRVLLAPGIPGLWRRAHASEVCIFETYAAAGERGAPVTSGPQVATVRSLLSVCALEVVGQVSDRLRPAHSPTIRNGGGRALRSDPANGRQSGRDG
jgi:hypothetical protein